MLEAVIELHHQPILNKLSLEEGVPINRTVEEAFKAEVPEEVFIEFPGEEILDIVAREVIHHLLKIC
jgi:hypothetical protein